ncbi:MAG: amino acid adenylation domain-containing protein, partial [bacterium]|nr:amino acid adenylation domain-containing protein [bacterium]
MGATLYIAGNEIRTDAVKMMQWLVENKIEITFQPTVMAGYLLKEDWPEKGVALKILATAGDKLTTRPRKYFPFKVYNLYGPTEDTVWTTWREVTTEGVNGKHSGKAPFIGKPIPNHRIYILGPTNELLPRGITGEICISGKGLAKGYLNRPELTAEKFIKAPSFPNIQYPITNNQYPGNHFYKT